jgi:hypothetical protein
MITQSTHKCIIRENVKIRTLLNHRLRTFHLTAKEVVLLGKEDGCNFSESQLSRYRKHGNVKGGLLAPDVLWLCNAFAIDVQLSVKRRKFVSK